MAKKRRSSKRRKNPSPVAVTHKRRTAKKGGIRRRRNPGVMKSDLVSVLTEVGAAAVGFVGSDFLTSMMGMKYTPAIGYEEKLKAGTKKGLWILEGNSKEISTSEGISMGVLSKKIVPNVLIPGLVGFGIYTFLGKGKYSKYAKAIGLGAMINAAVEGVEAVRKLTHKENIDPVLNGLGGLGAGYDALAYDPQTMNQLALEAARNAASVTNSSIVSGISGYEQI